MNKVLLREIARRFFIGQPVKIGINREGQGLTKANAYLLGCYAGPEQHEEHLFHEMCHLAERETDKLLEKPGEGWGFSLGNYWEIAGSSGYEPRTEQAVLREGRVWSYQLSLMRHFQMDVDPRSIVECAVYLPSFCYFKFKRISKKKKLSYQEREEAAIDELAKLVETQTAQYSYESFERNWFERMELLRIKGC